MMNKANGGEKGGAGHVGGKTGGDPLGTAEVAYFRMLLSPAIENPGGSWQDMQSAIEGLDKPPLVEIAMKAGLGKKTALGRLSGADLSKKIVSHSKKELGK